MKFKLIIPIIIIFLFSTYHVQASESDTSENEETSYFINAVTCNTKMSSPSGYYRGYIFDLQITSQDYKFVMYKDVTSSSLSIKIIAFNDNGLFDCGIFIDNMSKYISSYSMNGTYGLFNKSTLEFYEESYVNPKTEYHSLQGDLFWDDSTVINTKSYCGKLDTNIPIFSSKELAEGYINGSVSIKEATNYVDIVNNNVEHDCADIPVPKNLKVIEESGKYYLTWEQTEEELELFTCSIIQFDTENIKYRYEPIKNVLANTPWIDKADTLIYGSGSTIDYQFEVIEKSLVHKVDITASMIEFKKWCISKDWVAYKVDMIYTVVNIEGLADSSGAVIGTRQSSYVKAIVKIDWTEDSGMNVDVGYKHVDSTGALVNDSEYNKFEYGSDILNTSNGSNFIGNIVSGFNLLGDNGLIALITQTFSYIPAPIWTLVGAGISICIIVALFKMIL